MKMQDERKKIQKELRTRHNLSEQQTKQQKERKSYPMSWNSSEAILHMHGENTLETKEKTTGLYDRQGDSRTNTRMNEVLRAENSYGNIAVGANKKKEAMLVVSQKREHDGETVKEEQKNVNMERKKRFKSSFGEHYGNNGKTKESAWAYKGNTKQPEKRMWMELKKFYNKTENKSMEKQMPFLTLEEDKKQMVSLREQIREYYENGQMSQAQRLEKHKQAIQQEIAVKEQNEKKLEKKLRFAWEKARKIGMDDFEIRRTGRLDEEKEGDLSETPNLDENNEEKSEK